MDRRQFIKIGLYSAAGVAVAGALGYTGARFLNRSLNSPAIPQESHEEPVEPPKVEEFDVYGGYTGVKGKETGFFHLEEINGMWYFITPLGNGFFGKGIDHARYDEHNYSDGTSIWEENNERTYGSEEAWADATANTLKAFGINTIGTWASKVFHDSPKMPYVNMLYFNEAAPTHELFKTKGTADYFDPRFEEACQKIVDEFVIPRKNDPYLLHHELCNEPKVTSGSDWRTPRSVIELYYYELDEDSYGKARAKEFLSSKNKTIDTLTRIEKDEFSAIVYDQFCKLTTSYIRKYDSNHIVSGIRPAGADVPDQVLRAITPYIDLFTYNDYADDPQSDFIKRAYSIMKMPMKLTEFGFVARDSGFRNGASAAKVVDTQAQRASEYREHYLTLSSLPMCVGGDMFQLTDQPYGRTIEETNNFGLIDIRTGEPYQEVTNELGRILPTLEKRRARKN